MSDRLTFLRAIRASPDDDTVRLVFADWLDEHDDPLGGFIRVQIELEPIRFRIDDPRAVELHAREDELLRKHRDEWIGDADDLMSTWDFGPVFRRGFPEYACLSLNTFLIRGEALFVALPTLRNVALYGVANRCDELTLCPLLAKLTTLEIADWPTRDDAAALAVSPHLENISRFKLWVGGDPQFLREFVRQSKGIRPREIELVQVRGGAMCLSADVARELNNEADALAREMGEHLGHQVVRVTRPFERLFPLNGKVAWNIHAGHLLDGRSALVAGNFVNWMFITFTRDGRIQDVTLRNSAFPVDAGHILDIERRLALQSAFGDWVEDLQLEPGLIWVREFAIENLRINLWPEQPQGWTPDDWRVHLRDAWNWLERHDFVIYWDDEAWANWRGAIHSSLA
ncbi:TIGR02996 domain-containing protein [Gemmata sp. G18]|uniref:TIGR02996 domain-containing protein n=1 Tax=Gemmata palustris TaxID=2822762 RepID=A0ABS5BYI5_9BACT|nr:TIGR02996 domain-containing protein [Gemmata palustris]MBP3958733.1 TIGR02996 domain-containing protein [Gemmata palustris]